MPMYKKKPVVVEAHRLMEPFTPDDIASWCDGRVCSAGHIDEKVWIEMDASKGVMRADYGDYIIKGVDGEFYPIKEELFKKTYERTSPNIDKDNIILQATRGMQAGLEAWLKEMLAPHMPQEYLDNPGKFSQEIQKTLKNKDIKLNYEIQKNKYTLTKNEIPIGVCRLVMNSRVDYL